MRKVALLLPYNGKLDILFQNRKEINKPYTKDYGFFGGGVESGETTEQALAREIKEELGININELKGLEFFKKYVFKIIELKTIRELNVFLCKMPDMNKLKIGEGKAEIFNIKNAINLNISERDKKILGEIYNYLVKKYGKDNRTGR